MIRKFNKSIEYGILIFYFVIVVVGVFFSGDDKMPGTVRMIIDCLFIMAFVTEYYLFKYQTNRRKLRSIYMSFSLNIICMYTFGTNGMFHMIGIAVVLVATLAALFGEVIANIISITLSFCYSFIIFIVNYPNVDINQTLSQFFMILTELVIIILLYKNNMIEQQNKYRQQSNEDLLKALELKKDEAMKVNKVKADFLATMSHEVRTPMNAICGMADLLAHTQLTPLSAGYVNTIKSASDNLLNIVNDILDFSKIESGKLVFSNVEYEVSGLICTVQNIINTKLENKPIVFLINVNPKLPRSLYGDELRVQQVLLNLLSNAVKFTEKGQIVLTVDYEMITSSSLLLKASVRDTGIGIKKEDLSKLFNTFTQIDIERNRNIEGTGLGLAITAQLTKQMDGRVTVSSVYGEGSEFVAYMEQQIADSTPCDAPLLSRRDKMLYVFEEDKVYREGIKVILEDIRIPYIFMDDIYSLKNILKNQKREIVLFDYDKYQTEVMVLCKDYENVLWAGMVDLNQVIAETTVPNICYLHKPVTIFSIMPVVLGEIVKSRVKRTEIAEFYAPNARVLVVDDTPANIKVAEGLIEEYKIQVVSAESGAEALNILETDKNFDIIFVDHMMPVMDGVELVRRIRLKKDEFSYMVPIVALTANAIKGIEEMFFKNGFDDFISKPISIKRLNEVLDKWLSEDKKATREAFTEGLVSGNENIGRRTKFEHAFDGIPGFSYEDGLNLCDDNLEILLNVISVYVKASKNTIEKLNAAFNSRDEYMYGIEAHSLKSSSRNIGANVFADRATAMERECKAGHWNYVVNHHVSFVSEYEDLLRWLEEGLDEMNSKQSTGTKKTIDFPEIVLKLLSVKEHLKEWDSVGADAIVKGILSCEISDKYLDKINSISDSIELFDYNIAIEKIDAFKTEG